MVVSPPGPLSKTMSTPHTLGPARRGVDHLDLLPLVTVGPLAGLVNGTEAWTRLGLGVAVSVQILGCDPPLKPEWKLRQGPRQA